MTKLMPLDVLSGGVVGSGNAVNADKWRGAGIATGPQRSVAWRILNAKFFGVPQRRRRIFVVATARKDINPAKILFEYQGYKRNITSSDGTGGRVTPYFKKGFNRYAPGVGCLRSSGGDFGGGSETLLLDNTGFLKYREEKTAGTITTNVSKGISNAAPLLVEKLWPPKVTNTLDANYGKLYGCDNQHIDGGASLFTPMTFNWQQGGNLSHNLGLNTATVSTLTSNQTPAICIASNTIGRGVKNGGNGKGFKEDESYTLDTLSHPHAVAYTIRHDNDIRTSIDIAPTLTANMGKGGGNVPAIISLNLVRRFTPIECERLQGFPDKHTQIPYGNKLIEKCPDAPRYKAIGNSMAVVVMKWLGLRIKNTVEGVN